MDDSRLERIDADIRAKKLGLRDEQSFEGAVALEVTRREILEKENAELKKEIERLKGQCRTLAREKIELRKKLRKYEPLTWKENLDPKTEEPTDE